MLGHGHRHVIDNRLELIEVEVLELERMDDDHGVTFDRMNQKVEQIEAESEASMELGGELAGDTLQQKFKQLEGGTGSEMALAELKAKMGLGPAPDRPALPAGPTADELKRGTGSGGAA